MQRLFIPLVLSIAMGLLVNVAAAPESAVAVTVTRPSTQASQEVVKRFFAIWQPYLNSTGAPSEEPPMKAIAPYLTPEFHALVARALKGNATGRSMDFDPFTGSQDRVWSTKVQGARHVGDHDVVTVVGQGIPHGPKFNVTALVRHVGKFWLIDDVGHGKLMPSLRQWIRLYGDK
jgi:hypothetical protein